MALLRFVVMTVKPLCAIVDAANKFNQDLAEYPAESPESTAPL